MKHHVITIRQLMLIISMICGLTNATANAAEPPLITMKQLDFVKFMPVSGRCDMPHDTGIFVNDAANICTSTAGYPGHYRIMATPNTVVDVTVYTYVDPDNPLTFKPAGIVRSSVETKALLNDLTSSLNSGSSGRIDVYIGGVVTLTDSVPSSTSFDTLLTMDIAEQ